MDNQLPHGESPDTTVPSTTRYFSDETLNSLRELGDLLREIHTRLLFEGYTIHDGKISKDSAPVHNDEPNTKH